MTQAHDTILAAEDLAIGYGSTVIQRDVTFSVKTGEVFVIVGGSGCGKSTLLRHLVGLNPPLGGRVILQGKDLSQTTSAEEEHIRRNCGMLFQSGALFGSLTLGENIDIVLQEYTSLPAPARAVVVRMKLKLVGLDGYENYLPGEISGGMKKRAGLARALACDPTLVFFDEPSAGLDPVTSRELDETILQLNKSLGTTIVIVTHELPSIYTVADRVVMLGQNGEGVIAEGMPSVLKAQKEPEIVHAFFNRESRPQS